MASPELHLHQLDLVQRAGLFVQMPPGAYRAASFLDGRSFTPQTLGGWIPLQRIRDTVLAAAPPAAPLHFIFHMGHTGSTLLSRLLDESGMVQGLREPLVLRDLASLADSREEPSSLVSPDDIDAYAEILLRLWSRCREGRRLALLKATSATARVGEVLMAARPQARAVYLSMAAEPYLAVILGGPASLMDVRGHAAERMRRLIRMLGSAPKPLYAMGAGEMVAASWLTEALTRDRLRRASGERVLQIDFDRFLADIPSALRSILNHYQIPGSDTVANQLARSPVLGQYAKAPEHAYSSRLRDDVISSSRQQNASEISSGLRLIEGVANQHQEVKDLLA